MVLRHGVDISIVDLEGNPFTEYGEHSIGRQGASSRITSTKIEAKTAKPFHILIKPHCPFPYSKDETGEKGKLHKLPTSQHFLRNKTEANDQPVLSKPVVEAAAENEPPSTHEEKSGLDPPFQLSAYVFVDGNSKPECRSIIHLDPNDPAYKPSGTKLKGRWETDKNPARKSSDTQAIRALAWVFTPFGGLDYWLDKLDVNAADAVIPTEADEIVDNDLSSMMAGNRMEGSQAKKGVIRVVFKRIVVEGPVRPTNQAEVYARRSGEANDNTASAEDWVTHEAGVEKSKAVDLRLHIMEWSSYKKNEDFFAEFQFQYMGRAKLVNMGLSELDGTPRQPFRRAPEAADKPTSKKRGADSTSDEPAGETPNKRATSYSNGSLVGANLSPSLGGKADSKAQGQPKPQPKPRKIKQLRLSTMKHREQYRSPGAEDDESESSDGD